jgi:hypothetical protein
MSPEGPHGAFKPSSRRRVVLRQIGKYALVVISWVFVVLLLGGITEIVKKINDDLGTAIARNEENVAAIKRVVSNRMRLQEAIARKVGVTQAEIDEAIRGDDGEIDAP